jgi:hypothetical protein
MIDFARLSSLLLVVGILSSVPLEATSLKPDILGDPFGGGLETAHDHLPASEASRIAISDEVLGVGTFQADQERRLVRANDTSASLMVPTPLSIDDPIIIIGPTGGGEFDPAPTVPEPGNILLLGGGLSMMVRSLRARARRLRR